MFHIQTPRRIGRRPLLHQSWESYFTPFFGAVRLNVFDTFARTSGKRNTAAAAKGAIANAFIDRLVPAAGVQVQGATGVMSTGERGSSPPSARLLSMLAVRGCVVLLLPLRGVWHLYRAGPRKAEPAYFRARVMCEVRGLGRACVRARAIACVPFPPSRSPVLPRSGACARTGTCTQTQDTHARTHDSGAPQTDRLNLKPTPWNLNPQSKTQS